MARPAPARPFVQGRSSGPWGRRSTRPTRGRELPLFTADDPRAPLAPLTRLARESATAGTPEAIRAAVEDAGRLLLDAGHVCLLDPTQGGGGATPLRAEGERAELPEDYLRFDGPSGTGRVVATGRPFAVPDARTSPDIAAGRAERHGLASVLFAPLHWDGGVQRVLVLSWYEPREIADADVELAELIAGAAAAGLARLEADARRAARSVQDHAVVRAALALNASLELGEILHTLAQEASRALGADRACVFLGNRRDGATAAASHNMPEGWEEMQVASGEGAAGIVLQTGAPFVTHDYGREVLPPGHPLADEVHTAVSVPMVWDDELRGALSVAWAARRPVSDEDLRALEAVAGLATTACRNAEAYEHVQHVARTDALTGVLNHGAMQLRIREEIARARRDATPLGAVILDLDDFKRVNDTRGHAAGDELLRRVARLLQGELRPYDQVARYGGDEFVLLLPGSDEPTTAAVAERCRDAIGGQCSIGVAAWHDGLDADGLLEQADRALMLAKRTGKGRVAVANAEVERELALLQSRSGSPAAVQALAAAIEERDNYTHEHSQRLVHLARGVAMMVGLPADDVDRIAHAALLHDVGKLAMPAELLEKAGPLTPEEWRVMAEHSIAGERILLRTKDLAGIAPTVRHVHEHWNGTGYPDGLERHRIPLGARIILPCHAYVAMIAPRPYREALTPEAAIAELQAGAGVKFDPEVVDALLDLLGQAPPQVPDRSAGVKLAAPIPPEPTGRRKPASWAPGS